MPDVYKRQGTALVLAGLEKLESRHEPLVIVRGHPSYYPRFGFVPSARLGIRPPFEIAEEAYMAKRLKAYSSESVSYTHLDMWVLKLPFG